MNNTAPTVQDLMLEVLELLHGPRQWVVETTLRTPLPVPASSGSLLWSPMQQVAMLGAAESVARFFRPSWTGRDGRRWQVHVHPFSYEVPRDPDAVVALRWHCAHQVLTIYDINADIPPLTALVHALAQALLASTTGEGTA